MPASAKISYIEFVCPILECLFHWTQYPHPPISMDELRHEQVDTAPESKIFKTSITHLSRPTHTAPIRPNHKATFKPSPPSTPQITAQPSHTSFLPRPHTSSALLSSAQPPTRLLIPASPPILLLPLPSRQHPTLHISTSLAPHPHQTPPPQLPLSLHDTALTARHAGDAYVPA